MSRLVVALIALPVALGAGTFKAASAEQCMTGDSAICLADPNCHWDGEKRGCYPGAGPKQDACASHGDQAICDMDVSLGCQWSAETSTCESKPD